MSQLIERLIALEADVRYNEPPSDIEPEFLYVAGQVPILLSAPHGAVHTRDGDEKEEDEYTAGFAWLVAELTNAHVIYVRRKSHTDPNWDQGAPYKECLGQIVEAAGIRFVLDIHGVGADRGFGVALGTINGQSCPDHEEIIIRTLEDHGFRQNGAGLDRLAVNHPSFTGGTTQATVTSYVSENLGVPAAQFELNAHLRIASRFKDASPPEPFHGDAERIERAINAFAGLVPALA